MTTTILPLIYRDLTPIISNAFSKSLIEQGVAGDRWHPDTIELCCPAIEEAAAPATIEDAWWYDPNEPASAGFAGPIMDRRMTNMTKGWVNVGGKIIPAPRNITTQLILYAIDEVSLQYGLEATMRQLGVSEGRSCETFSGALYLGCDESLRRTFCGAKIISCTPASTERDDAYDLSGTRCPVGCVLDVVLEIADGCLWGEAELVTAPDLESESVKMCNPNAIVAGTCCPAITSALGETAVSCRPIDPRYTCAPGSLIPVESAKLCDPFCPPLFMYRTVLRIPVNADLGYAASFSLANSGNTPLYHTEITLYPASLFDDAGIDPADPAMAGITGCVQPATRARIPYLPPQTTVMSDGRCGDIHATCEGAEQLPYRPSELFSASGTPTSTTLTGVDEWVAFIDTKCNDNLGALTTTPVVYLTPCSIS